MSKPIVLLAVAMLVLAGCGVATKGIGATAVALKQNAEFNTLFLEDVQQAKIMAERTDDILALHCWEYLEQFAIDNAPDPDVEQGDVVGALSTYQKARNVRRTIVEVEISDHFRLNCGPMLTDSTGVLGRLAGRLRIILPLPL